MRALLPFLVALLVMVLSGLTLVGGGLLFATEMRGWPGEAVLSHLQSEQTPDADALQQFGASRERQLEILRDPQSLGELALARLMLSEPRGPARAGDLARAESLLVEALAQAPANPYLWARLALVRELLDRPTAQVLPAIDLSSLTGPNIAKLALLRVELALRHLPRLSPVQREALEQQVWLAWRHSPETLVEMADINGQLPLVEEVIAAHGGDLHLFLRLQFLPALPKRP